MNQTKARLKLNIVDIAVLIVLAAAIVFLLVRVLGQNSRKADAGSACDNACTVPADYSPNLRAQMLLEDVSPELAARISATEYRRIYNNFTLLDAYITDISVQQREDGRADILFEVAARVDTEKPDAMIDGNFNPIIGDREVRVGCEYILKTLDIQLNVIVTDLEILYEP